MGPYKNSTSHIFLLDQYSWYYRKKLSNFQPNLQKNDVFIRFKLSFSNHVFSRYAGVLGNAEYSFIATRPRSTQVQVGSTW